MLFSTVESLEQKEPVSADLVNTSELCGNNMHNVSTIMILHTSIVLMSCGKIQIFCKGSHIALLELYFGKLMKFNLSFM
jgi:hypothetical protein